MSKERQPGYYWCRDGDKWHIAEWDAEAEHWFCTGIKQVFTDALWDEIDETPVKRKD